MKKMIRFYIIYSFFALMMNMTQPIMPQLFKQLHFSSIIYGLSFALMAGANFISSFWWSKWINRYDVKKVMGISFIGYSVSCYLLFITDTIYLLLLSRVLAGFFMAGLMVASLSYILYLSHQVIYLIIFALIQTVGSSLGYFIGGWLSQFGYAWVFYIQIIGGIMAAVLAQCLLPKLINKQTTQKTKHTSMNKTKWLFFGCVFLSCLAYFMHDNWLNYYFVNDYQYSAVDIGYFKFAEACMSLSIHIIFIFYLSKINKILTYILIGCGLSLLSVWIVENPYYFLIGTLIYSLFSVLFIPLLQSKLAYLGKDKAQQSAMFNVFRSIGMMIGPVVSGGIYPYFHKGTLVMSIICFFLAASMSVSYFKSEVELSQTKEEDDVVSV